MATYSVPHSLTKNQQRKMFMPLSIGVATLFGGLTAGFLLIGINHLQTRNWTSKIECATLAIAGAIFQVALAMLLFNIIGGVFVAPIVGLFIVFGMASSYYADEHHLLQPHEIAKPRSAWLGVAVGLPCMLLNLVLLFATSVAASLLLTT